AGVACLALLHGGWVGDLLGVAPGVGAAAKSASLHSPPRPPALAASRGQFRGDGPGPRFEALQGNSGPPQENVGGDSPEPRQAQPVRQPWTCAIWRKPALRCGANSYRIFFGSTSIPTWPRFAFAWSAMCKAHGASARSGAPRFLPTASMKR